MDEDETIASLAKRLVDWVRQFDRCLVAYSGGVDSAVVAYAAHTALDDGAVAITGVSSSLAAGELDAAQRLARTIGIRHATLSTGELADPRYLQNAPDRCFHCKTELYAQLQREGSRLGIATILNGANIDDLGDFRPGMKAAQQYGVRSPLVECGLSKAQVRAIARHWKIAAWNKPATPCLSSRVAYGLEITSQRLAMIDAAERLLRESGLEGVRVRLHANELARVEASLSDLPRLCSEPLRTTLVARLCELGFRYVTIDLEGFRSGSFQQLASADELARFSRASTKPA